MNFLEDSELAKDNHMQKWFIRSSLGAILFGVGIVLVTYSAILFVGDVSAVRWFIAASGGLIVMISGLSVFGDGIKNRIYYELNLDKELRTKSIRRIVREIEE